MTEKVLAIFVAILLVLVIILGYQKSSLDVKIGNAEYAIIQLREEKIEAYDTQIVDLQNLISTLQTERDKLKDEKSKIKIVTITKIDSIRTLPFTGKRVFWAIETTRLDSVRIRYLSRN
jgi:peptidoglycan hydrolase CwlO-like protein